MYFLFYAFDDMKFKNIEFLKFVKCSYENAVMKTYIVK